MACDFHGNCGSTPTHSYRVVDLERDGYTTTFPTYSFIDITGGGGGTEIQASEWIPVSRAEDDGSAGPFSLGGSFAFFGNNFTYCWVGVNGGLALTTSSSETVYVRNGAFANLDIPGADVANFVPAFWNDLYASPGGHGSVWYRAASNQFIVQWNRIGNFNSATDTTTTFEIILDLTDNSVTYPYADVGVTGLELSGMSGIQGSAPPGNGWLFLNHFGYPEETRPRNQWAVRMTYMPTSVPISQELPTEFKLYANYPNPFNPGTEIRYQTSEVSHVTLKVFDVLGREVVTLVNGVKQPGMYTAHFDASGLSSGVYFYRLHAGSFADTKKLLLLR